MKLESILASKKEHLTLKLRRKLAKEQIIIHMYEIKPEIAFIPRYFNIRIRTENVSTNALIFFYFSHKWWGTNDIILDSVLY